ncbi:DUF1905 domain-containing protein [Lewinella sp. 4G2]|uniref:DUF1905 domain-containing protein n=1 Tax=Lewinella sp. 4G2 TaxID=1803372 RepID=UPI0007B4E6B3|nr:DUF1905 domain-containing protein [Lewinella sp. 4G2]OAV44361.1 hypothetical protein A3850_007575 [Lewinella sp. 4G2]
MQITFTSIISSAEDGTNYGGVYLNIIKVKRKVVADLLDPDNALTRVIMQINGEGATHRALHPDGNGNYFILISKEIQKEHRVDDGEEIEITLRPDDSKYGMPLPEEVSELWAMDEEARRVFHLLTLGRQRSMLYLMGKPKGAATRVKKTVQIHEYLKSTNGVLDSKELNAYIKADNANWK